MTKLYPLKFNPILKDKIWGGDKIQTVLGKDFSPLPNCGESWEISGYGEEISVVNNGALKGKKLDVLINEYQSQLLGKKVFEKFAGQFPLLIKFIDANQDLSIQVHPDDELAKKRHNGFGKTEMWYVFQADEGSSLISGFNREMDKETYLEKFNNGDLMEVLNQEPVEADDVFFLPAGRVHTIGKGLLLAEIQQTSDFTYRIYDFDRKDDQGNKRELHLDEAIDAIDYKYYGEYKTKYVKKKNEAVQLASCPYFETNRLHYDEDFSRDYSGLDSFVIFICMEGSAEVDYGFGTINLGKGETLLVPASITKVAVSPQNEFKAMECYIP